MTSGAELNYNGFMPQNCSLTNVVIRQWFTAMPIYMPAMNMDCDQGVSLSVFDATTSFLDQNFGAFESTFSFFKNYPAGSASMFEALGFKYNMTDGGGNVIFLFNSTGAITSVATSATDVHQNLYFETMQLALGEVQNSTLPGVRYQCSRCGRNADWTGQMGSLTWNLIYNTVNTVGSATAIILTIITFGMKDGLMDLLRPQEIPMGTDFKPLL
ncbi:hypothetical protein BGZ58_004219 [Dissophora ornata]|nr:hypothetical protein BGZ58_004219 [Dissophora ornata]